MKSILLLVHDDSGQEGRLQVALDLTRGLRGHLTCLDVSIAPEVMDDYVSLGGAALLMEDERAAEARNRRRIEPRLSHEDVPWDWIDVAGNLGDQVVRAARLSDIIVVSEKLPNFATHDMANLPGELLIRTNRPILAVPEDATGLDLTGTAVVAWDGSPEAEAALRAAVPLLQLAKSVTLLEIDDGSVALPAGDAATYLSRHGVKPVVSTLAAGGNSASTVILNEIGNQAADYLVMGGFGHARLTEALFGGVTRRMLAECPVPTLLAH
ncbi:universal stress protein [Sphingomonas sp. DC1600-2]|uniref:universal stress protein n=2 Tax=Pseudomonadota TaxID=1224 RepID=UPI003CEA1DFF